MLLMSSLRLEEFLPYRLNRLAEAVSREFSAIYRKRYGLTRPSWRLLATLGQFETMTATEVGQHSSMHKTKVSRAVIDLEKRKWLVRSTDTEDRRLEHLKLSAAGRRVYEDLIPLANSYEERLLSRIVGAEPGRIVSDIALLEEAAGCRPRR